MREANKLAIFERQSPVLDYFIGKTDAWEEVTKAWGELAPVPIVAHTFEQTEGVQRISETKYQWSMMWTPITDRITTDHRMKIAKPVPQDEANPNADANYRIFQIQSRVNVGERNREIQLTVIERT